MTTTYRIPGAAQGFVTIVDGDDDGIIGDEDCVSVTPGLCSSFSHADAESIVRRQLGIDAQQLKGTHLQGLVRYFTLIQAAEEAAQGGNAQEMVRLLTDAESESESYLRSSSPPHIINTQVFPPHVKEVLQKTYDTALVDAARAFKNCERARSHQGRRPARTFAPHWERCQRNVYLAEQCSKWGASGNEQELARLRHLTHRDVQPACFPWRTCREVSGKE